MSGITQKLLEIHHSGIFTQFSPEETVKTHEQLREVLNIEIDRLTDVEYYDLIELGFYLSLIMGKDKESRNCLQLLVDKFGDDLSPRIASLKATYLQATEGTQAAIEYLSKRPGDELQSLKKRISLNSSNKDKKYVELLLGLLDFTPLDVETWSELGETYYQLANVDKAIWCFQEVLLIQPFNYYVCARLGELYHALYQRDRSKKANLELSIKYFARSVELCSNLVRGWSGLLTTTKESGNDTLHNLASDKLKLIEESQSATREDLNFIKEIKSLS